MKKIIYLVLAVLTFGLNSCYDEKIEWGDPYTHPDASELPLELQEKISRYEALTAYTNFKLGVGIDFSLYTNNEAYSAMINENFREVTPGNEMKQSSLMKTDGTLDFSKIDPIIDALQQAKLTVYGHTLVWHSQQQAAYLNGLIKPIIIPGTPGESLIVNGSFETGLDGWNPPYYAEAVSQSEDFAIDGTHSMKVAVGDWGGDKYNMQINGPEFSIIKEHHYEISFFIKSDIVGGVGLDFPDTKLGNQYPSNDGIAVVPTSSAWSKVTYNPTTVGGTGMTATADGKITFRLLLGAVKNCTYYIDGVEVIDLEVPAEPTHINLISNSDFETVIEGGNGYGLGPWNCYGDNNPTRSRSEEGEGYNSGYAMVIVNPISSDGYKTQAVIAIDELIKEHIYTAEAWIKSSVADAVVQMELQNSSYGGIYSANYTLAQDQWTKISHDFTADAGRIRFVFDLGKTAATYYIDNVLLYDKTAETPQSAPALRAGPTEIPKTPEEKAQILEPVLQKYITDVASHFAGKVAAWDVVNEPMNDNGTLRTGEENLKSTGVFYWPYYLGQDYAVTAFKAARQADPNAKLFINDYGLESPSGAKVDGLIEYMRYIDSQGAKVDGIGTQLHLNINWTDTTGIKTMFEKLAATGKLIKVSELDIAIANSSDPESPVSPTVEQYAQQADLYRFVAEMYNKYIPEAQRYGITVWGVSDNENEHEYWLKNDAPCLWNADYERKHAYKGFADGLAGKDVSADFSGELQY